ncbi:ribosome biogenesis GTP-binding protein YihA/YsxC [Ureaplasma miroungigenitalium]|uniref:ribosome biogenesis GTP-binding protein YihA/YsxC n=1 Tax=Ureaplasma miroungigenitalium TaxID=1042321 RepID=UPI002961FF3F|nr:ribosome biogenesis GTP-binding protein YihA/YsxC [Ureaplasma miroungigenitalium]
MPVVFLKSASKKEEWIDDQKDEVCLIGRSNVGKSSLINALANQKIAKTSNTPGRTQLVNFFDFNSFRLVDLPGYGFARVNKQRKDELTFMIEQYLTQRTNLKAVFQICDLNVLTDLDAEMSKFFEKQPYRHFLVLNKADKANKSYFTNKQKQIVDMFQVPADRIILVSAKNKTNVDFFLRLMKSVTRA